MGMFVGQLFDPSISSRLKYLDNVTDAANLPNNKMYTINQKEDEANRREESVKLA